MTTIQIHRSQEHIFKPNGRAMACTNELSCCCVMAEQFCQISGRKVFCQFLRVFPLNELQCNTLTRLLQPCDQFSVFYIAVQIEIRVISCCSSSSTDEPELISRTIAPKLISRTPPKRKYRKSQAKNFELYISTGACRVEFQLLGGEVLQKKHLPQMIFPCCLLWIFQTGDPEPSPHLV